MGVSSSEAIRARVDPFPGCLDSRDLLPSEPSGPSKPEPSQMTQPGGGSRCVAKHRHPVADGGTAGAVWVPLHVSTVSRVDFGDFSSTFLFSHLINVQLSVILCSRHQVAAHLTQTEASASDVEEVTSVILCGGR